jgi:hypothetical protein
MTMFTYYVWLFAKGLLLLSLLVLPWVLLALVYRAFT